jgi:hypothetical protein
VRIADPYSAASLRIQLSGRPDSLAYEMATLDLDISGCTKHKLKSRRDTQT